MISLDFITSTEMAAKIASNVKLRRLERNLTQEELASRAGVKLPTYRKFERTGQISLIGLLQLAFALDCMDDFKDLFNHRQYESIDDILNDNTKIRKRARNGLK